MKNYCVGIDVDKNTFKVYPNPSSRAWNFVSTSDKNITAILDISFFAVAMISAGIIDILIGVKLLKIK